MFLRNQLSLKIDRIDELGWKLVGTGKRKMIKMIRQNHLIEVDDDKSEILHLRLSLHRLLAQNHLFILKLASLAEQILSNVSLI